ncbi:MAG TPA: DUF3352 domain-containing protein, partial [Cyclobacteriaceae bacterium]|nr:DUF3352 domain-containing protein [Cyclobacteriaceae bacterium]
MRKFFIWVILLGMAGGAGWVGYKWYLAKGISSDALSLVPANAIYCVTTSDPIATWKTLSGSKEWMFLQKNAYFASLTASANSLDSMIKENDLLFNLIGSRQLIASAHMTGSKTHDFLFLVDLEGVSGIKFIKEYLTEFSGEGYVVSKEKFMGEDIIRMFSVSDKSNLYLATPGTFLIASYNKSILTASLQAEKGNNLLSAGTFTEVHNQILNSGFLQMFLNYRMLPRLMHCYSDDSNEYVKRFSLILKATSLNITLDDNQITASGHTYVNDSIESYFKTLAVSGKGATDFLEIAPQRTGFCVGFGFKSFPEFFQNLENNLQQDVAEYKSYKDNIHQVESYLKISVQENVIDWIGEEVALLELQSAGPGLENEVAVVLKASNIEQAKKNLDHIEKMVRKKTPVKFKTVEHKGFPISYLGMKGFFKIVLGKLFSHYDKPYFTIINNFVIFSSHPQALESLIDDYLAKNTLAKSESFMSFRRQFEAQSSTFVYLNTPILFNNLKKWADGPTRESMMRNKEFITSFQQFGFQLVPEAGGFKTSMISHFVLPIE